MNAPTPDSALCETAPPEDALHETALRFARAALDWRRLGDDRARGDAPAHRREAAQVFLRYHAAKLALEALADARA